MTTRTKREIDDEQPRLAVLIDADNAQPAVIESLLAEVARYGVASVKRIYGDFTSPQLTQWKKVLLRHSINPVQQFAYTSGKNATDSSLIIDAMDLMYTRRFDGFCLVSSDSDFTRLAQRLREEGLTVYGFGERKTPDAFVQACDKFIYTEILRPEAALEPAAEPKPSAPKPTAPATTTKQAKTGKAAKPAPSVPDTKASRKANAVPLAVDGAKPAATPPAAPKPEAPPFELIRQAIDEASDEHGWAQLGHVGTYLSKVRPDFDPRLYGHRKLSDLLKKHAKQYALEERTVGGNKNLYVRTLPSLV